VNVGCLSGGREPAFKLDLISDGGRQSQVNERNADRAPAVFPTHRAKRWRSRGAGRRFNRAIATGASKARETASKKYAFEIDFSSLTKG
jgi:hypothetical protein